MTRATANLLTFEEVADRLDLNGKDRSRMVRNLFKKHGVPFVDLGKGKGRVTEEQFSALLRDARPP